MTGTQTAQQVESAAQHAETAAEQAGGIDVGGHILHHILDSNEFEIVLPFIKIPLPHFELFGVDLSITKHVVMMWIVSAYSW